ncbi:ABC transporter permease [Egicoccus sp. AB-alg2]|uniref:ABC transporter permease n=1 Tax=Egicoccus sp. AB-alg2 TaxID=3242693 RepID=UPI00359E3EE5
MTAATEPTALAPPAVSKRRKARRPVPAMLVVGAIGLFILVAIFLFGEQIAGYTSTHQALTDRLLPPMTDGHLLGTDQLGRDVFARVAAGFRWSLPVGFLAATMATTIGTILGVAAGWSEGIVRNVITRVIDMAISFPYFVLATAIIAVVGRGFTTLIIVLGSVAWVSVARVVYAETRALKEREYILAARLIGVPPARILFTYVLRGLRARVTVMFAFLFADLLVAEAALSYLGIGAPVGAPSWGNMLFAARDGIFTAPWLLWGPAAAVVLAVITANMLGDGLNQRWNVGVEQE